MFTMFSPLCVHTILIFHLHQFAAQTIDWKTEQCICEYSTQTETLEIKCVTQASIKHDIYKCFKTYVNATKLIFSESGLKAIPPEISILRRLVYLDLTRNNLTNLDLNPIVQICERLEFLYLDQNTIQTLGNGSMDCLSSLRLISLTNNTLSVIENGTFNDRLKSLLQVNLMYNSLTSLDSSVAYLPMLSSNKSVKVNATWNNINLITNHRNVSVMDIQHNYSFVICLTHNNFTGINLTYYLELFHVTNILQLYRLERAGFDVRFNPFICDCDMEPLAERLREFRPMDPDNPVFSIACHQPSQLSGMMVYKVPKNQFNCSIPIDCPKGCSCSRTIALQLVTIECDDTYFRPTLPLKVPEQKLINIHMNSRNLKKLSNRDYLRNTTLLDVSSCAIETISIDVLWQMFKIQTVELHANALIRMPREIENVRIDGLRSMTLRGNPFACDCHSLWFKKWLLSNKRFVSDIDKILCGSGPGKGKTIIEVEDSDFKCEYPLTTKKVLIIVFSVVFLMILIFVLIHNNRTNIQVMLIAHFKINCFRRKALGDFPYDVFISHSSKDDVWVIETLIRKLENETPPYKIFFDERDFEPGKTIIYNVIRAIKLSRTTLLVLTNNFLRSDWCMMEFKQAYLKLLKDNDINFIVIIMEELDQALIGQELKFYLRTHVYIKYNDKYFWPKLLQALPMAGPNTNGVLRHGVSERTPLL